MKSAGNRDAVTFICGAGKEDQCATAAGEYLVFVEEDYKALLYRWRP